MDRSILPIGHETSLSANSANDVSNANLNIATQVQVGSNAVTDSSIFSILWHAPLLIKCVVLGLFVASIWSWSIIIAKYFRLRKLNSYANSFEEDFWSGEPLETLYEELKESVFDPFSGVFCSAMAEWKRFKSKSVESSIRSMEQRIDRAMQIVIRKEIDDLEKGMSFLSSLGTNGVIIGIFGTVLGIMGGFKVIAIQQSTSIGTIAPIIAEALFTTAVGLVAAIPAAIFYNKLHGDIDSYISRLETFADEFSTIISRQLDDH